MSSYDLYKPVKVGGAQPRVKWVLDHDEMRRQEQRWLERLTTQPGGPKRVIIVEDTDLQPGDHLATHRQHRALVRVLQDPIAAGLPTSARRKFLLYIVLPTLTVAVILTVIIIINLKSAGVL